MSTDTARRNKAAFRRLIRELDAGNIEIIYEIYDSAYMDHSGAEIRETHDGREGLVRGFQKMMRAFPNVRHTIRQLVAEGDMVAARVSATGVHTGPLDDLPPTQRSITLTATAIYRFADGKIVERWCDNSPSVLRTLRSIKAGSVQ